jgi:hypothetical protein
MSEVGVVLRIACAIEYHKRVITAFGVQACAPDAGEPPQDVLMITPVVDPKSTIAQHLDWLCHRLQTHGQLFQEITMKGATIGISCWSHCGENVGDFRLSKEQVAVLGGYGVSVLFRYVVDDAFRK